MKPRYWRSSGDVCQGSKSFLCCECQLQSLRELSPFWPMTDGTQDDLWGLRILFLKICFTYFHVYLELLRNTKYIPGDGSVNGLSIGFLVPDPLLLGLQQPLPTQVFPMVLSFKLSW